MDWVGVWLRAKSGEEGNFGEVESVMKSAEAIKTKDNAEGQLSVCTGE